jgi:hypothetical protein
MGWPPVIVELGASNGTSETLPIQSYRISRTHSRIVTSWLRVADCRAAALFFGTSRLHDKEQAQEEQRTKYVAQIDILKS